MKFDSALGPAIADSEDSRQSEEGDSTIGATEQVPDWQHED